MNSWPSQVVVVSPYWTHPVSWDEVELSVQAMRMAADTARIVDITVFMPQI